MARLYKFECEPNYPVVPKATLVFWVPDTNVQEILPQAVKLAEYAGFNRAFDGGANLTFLGSYIPTKQQVAHGTNVLVAISGEY